MPAPRKAFVNNPADFVSEAAHGLALADASLAWVPEHNLVLRADYAALAGQVALISGGGSGHEPAHAGFVGAGMLSGAVLGNVFASPSVDQVLAALRLLRGAAGVCVIVKNYTGDRVNFGVAIEQARTEGIACEMVVVADDVAIDAGQSIAGARGVAGTVLVHKIAGALAARGEPLGAVAAAAQRAADSIRSMGASLSVCTRAGAEPSDRIPPGAMEIGLGIHGEPGASQCPLAPVDDVVRRLLDKICDREDGRRRHVLLVNNLGAVPPAELTLTARAAVQQLQARGVAVARVLQGALMTSLDMNGVSLSLMPVAGDDDLALLDAPAGAAAWPGLTTPAAGGAAATVAAPPSQQPALGRPAELSAQGALAERCVRAAAAALTELAPQLGEWDAVVGDGDCGDTFANGAAAMLVALETAPLNDGAALLAALGGVARASMGGTSGGLYDIGLHAASSAFLAGGGDWAAAFAAGVDKVRFYGGAEVGMRTMLDALVPARDVLTGAGGGGGDPAALLREAAAAAEAGADATASASGVAAGRSSYVPEHVRAGVPDPGAKAAACWLRAVAEAFEAVLAENARLQQASELLERENRELKRTLYELSHQLSQLKGGGSEGFDLDRALEGAAGPAAERSARRAAHAHAHAHAPEDNESRSFRLQAELRGHTGAVYSAAFSPHGQLLATGAFDRSLRVWDVFSATVGEQAFVGSEHAQVVSDISWSHDSTHVLTASYDHSVRLWDLGASSSESAGAFHVVGFALTVAFAPADPSAFFVGSSNATFVRFDTRSGDPTGTWENDDAMVNSLLVDGDVVVTGDSRGRVRTWDARQPGEPLATLQQPSPDGGGGDDDSAPPVSCVAVSPPPDARLLAVNSYDNVLRVYDRGSALISRQRGGQLRLLHSLQGPQCANWPVRSSFFEGVGYARADARREDEDAPVRSVHDSMLLASGSSDGFVYVYDVGARDAELVQKLGGHKDRVYAAAFHPTDPVLASASADATVRIWAPRGGGL